MPVETRPPGRQMGYAEGGERKADSAERKAPMAVSSP